MTEDLRVDTGLVRESGGKLQTIAGLIPEPPATFSPPGGDALSTAIAGKVAEVVDPVVAQMPITKEALTRYAQNVLSAADKYDITDRQIAEEILKRLGLFDDASGAGSGSAGGGAGTAGAASSAAESAGSAEQQAASAGQQAGQMGQMMQLPMQMAQQAAQIPMQLASMAAAIPQAMMQGVQSAMQQAGQMSEMSGEDEEKPESEDPQTPAHADGERPDESTQTLESQPDLAAPGDGAGERAPEQQPDALPRTPEQPKPAPTRPAESSPEIAL
jgi:hypothetical protein